jgi:hypothetical protein
MRGLADHFIAAGHMSEGGLYVPPAPPRPQLTQGHIDISVPPDAWDPQDPRRFLPGFADEVRRLRREYLGREPHTGELIERAHQ